VKRELLLVALGLIVGTNVACDRSATTPEIPDRQRSYTMQTGESEAYFEEEDWFDESTPDHPCSPVLNKGPRELPFWFNINNVGLTKFWAPAPYSRVSIVSPKTAYYTAYGGVSQSDPPGWMGEGQLLFSCRIQGWTGGWHLHFGSIIGVSDKHFTVWRVSDQCPDGTWTIPGEPCPEAPPPSGGPATGGGSGEDPYKNCTYYEIAYFDINLETGEWTYLFTDAFWICPEN
jgi:hypothetical protein